MLSLTRRTTAGFSGFIPAIVVLLPLATACNTPWESQVVPLKSATPTVVVSPIYIPPPTPTFPPDGSVISQTLEGITISVAPLHADAHRVVLALRVEGPARPYRRVLELDWFTPGKLALSVDGRDLPWLGYVIPGNFMGVVAAAGEPVHGQGILGFDASKLNFSGNGDGGTQNLSLRLSLPMYENNNPDEIWPPRPVPTSATGATEPPTQVPPPSRMHPFGFSFDVPFDDRRIVLQPGQTFEQNGLKVTLEQVDITASETLVKIHYSATSSEVFRSQLNPGAYAVLTVANAHRPQSISQGATLVGEPDWIGFDGNMEGDFVFSFSETLLPGTAPVDYTVTITAGSSDFGMVGYASPPLGTWDFHFTVPATSVKR